MQKIPSVQRKILHFDGGNLPIFIGGVAVRAGLRVTTAGVGRVVVTAIHRGKPLGERNQIHHMKKLRNAAVCRMGLAVDRPLKAGGGSAIAG